MTRLLIDGVGDTAALLFLVRLAALAVGHGAPSVLDSLALLLVGHLADLVVDGVALLLLNRAALLLIYGLASGSSYNTHSGNHDGGYGGGQEIEKFMAAP